MLGTLADLAARVGGRVVGDASIAISRVDAVDEAVESALTFATDERYLAAALKSRAAAVLIDAQLEPAQPADKPLLVVESARHALVTLLQAFRAPRPQGPFRHPTAIIEDDAQVADDAYIGAHVYIGRGARVGAASVIDVGAYVGPQTAIGSNAWLHPRATVHERCVVGDRVVLHTGCVIGSEGFGWAFVEGRLERIPQIGNVELGNDVEIGANTCVDRAQTGSTRVGNGTKIDNLCQIGHNCTIGEHSALAALCGLAGTTAIGSFTKVGGQSGFSGHITIGSFVTIGGGSHVWSNIEDRAVVSGIPARDHRQQLRRQVTLNNLDKLFKRVEALERQR